jgi:hypothetical protein
MDIHLSSGIDRTPLNQTSAATRSRLALRVTPRRVQIALGAFWLLDGLLQFQPYMFSHNFLAQMITSMAAGQPGPIQWSITTAVRIATPYRVEFNAMFAIVQLVIGAGLIAGRRWVKPALVLSFAWAFVVWWFGEGLGMIPMGMASPLTGAPGAVLLYVLVGVMVWPTGKAPDTSAASAGPLGDYYARMVWGFLWLLLAVLMLQPVNRAAGALSSTFSTAAASSPGPFASLNTGLASTFADRGTASAIVLSALFAVIGIAVFLNWLRNAFLVVASLIGLLIWITGEYFGGMFTGQGTDPNSGPILVLLAAALWVATPARNTSTAKAGPSGG